MFIETAGAIAIGWVDSVFVKPPFTFSFIGFEWLQPLPKYGMYLWFGLMAILSLFIMLGFRYRLSTILLAILWTGVYLMHKTHYNNHHYLYFIMNWIFVFMPFQNRLSIDCKHNRVKERHFTLYYNHLIWIALLLIVYTYAALQKIYPDWINLTLAHSFVENGNINFLKPYKDSTLLLSIIAYGGIAFDLFIIPLLIYKKTRKTGIVLSLIFHLYNSFTFEIGTFPYVMIASLILFIDKDKLYKILKMQPQNKTFKTPNLSPRKENIITSILVVFIVINIVLPLRHKFYEDTAFWTEEGHRLSWRMMLRSKSGQIYFHIITENDKKITDFPSKILTNTQYRKMSVSPDMIYTYVQRLKKKYPHSKIYAVSQVALNGRQYSEFIDKTADLSQVKWHRFKHSPWVKPFPGWETK